MKILLFVGASHSFINYTGLMLSTTKELTTAHQGSIIPYGYKGASAA